MTGTTHEWRRPPSRQDWRDAAYLLLGLGFGPLWFGLVAVLYLSGIGAQFLPLGIVFFLLAQSLLRPIGRFERHLVRVLLREDITAPPPISYQRASKSRTRWLVNGWRWMLAPRLRRGARSCEAASGRTPAPRGA